MSGVWNFKPNGVYERAQAERSRVLVYLPTSQVISSYHELEQILRGLGWERYYGGAGGAPDLLQYHKPDANDLISLPRDFSRFTSVYMYDVVVKNPNVFHVRDM